MNKEIIRLSELIQDHTELVRKLKSQKEPPVSLILYYENSIIEKKERIAEIEREQAETIKEVKE